MILYCTPLLPGSLAAWGAPTTVCALSGTPYIPVLDALWSGLAGTFDRHPTSVWSNGMAEAGITSYCLLSRQDTHAFFKAAATNAMRTSVAMSVAGQSSCKPSRKKRDKRRAWRWRAPRRRGGLLLRLETWHSGR